MVSRMADAASTALPERLGRRLVQVDLSAALPVECRVAMAGNRFGIDQEQPGAAIRQRGADHQRVGAVTGKHRVLPSAHRPRIPLPHGLGGSPRTVGLAVAGFQMGERQQPLAGRYIIQ